MTNLLKIWHPERYQGRRNPSAYFEGWYFKLVDASGQHIMAVIPGVSFCQESGDSHAFIQIIDAMACTTHYFRYDIRSFSSLRNSFEIHIDDNIFSSSSIHLEVDQDRALLKGTVFFEEITAWPVTLLSPGIMGWFAYMPFMECYHGIVSLKHGLKGCVDFNGSHISFDGGIGYTEKDWGKSFPSAWIWIQSNHFEDAGVCLTTSVAKIPWLGKSFTGFIAGVQVGEKLYRFATYTGAVLEAVQVDENTVQIRISNTRNRLSIHGIRSKTGMLLSPKMGVMAKQIEESASAVVHICLSDKDNRIIFEGSGRNSGLEIMGDMSELTAGIKS